MKSLTIDTQKGSQRFIATVVLLVAALMLALTAGRAQELRRGVSVQMANTSNAAPMPAADNEDAWIVTITADGSLYFGAEPKTADELTDWMKTHPRNREARLYIKADARAPFASVEKALEIGRTMGFEAPVLLTSQAEPTPPGTMVSPKGLEVLVGAPQRAEIVVQINSGQNSNSLEVNNSPTPRAALQSSLQALLQSQTDKVVVVKAAGRAPFGQVINIVDTCRSLGAKAALATPEL